MFIHSVFIGQGRGESGVYPGNTGHELGKHPGRNTSQTQGTTCLHTLIHNQGQFRSTNAPTGMFLDSKKKLVNPEGMGFGKTCKETPHKQQPELGTESWSCEKEFNTLLNATKECRNVEPCQ